ncbi:MAG: ankyrin repeat domain-containing protein [Acidobacteria bacterium]|nr:ankyrin repeat domain-containing protein [Acidobacteriota bacterium]MBI3661433.1 ankyrin repeat domain-containing protein [Acidobacteriota bacterium]
MKIAVMVTVATLYIFSFAHAQQVSACKSEPAVERRVTRVASKLEQSDPLRQAIEHGERGSGIRQSWMQSMRRQGIRVARFRVRFSWEGRLVRNEIDSEEYYRHYSWRSEPIDRPTELQRIRSSVLVSELRAFIRARAEKMIPADMQRERFRRAFGTYILSVIDDECLPFWNYPPNIQDAEETELMRAVADENVGLVQKLLAGGADVNAKDHEGVTALMSSAWEDRFDVMKALLKGGADVNAADDFGTTALMLASRFTQLQEVHLLIQSGAQINAQDKVGNTALMYSAENGGNPEVISTLLQAGAQVNARNKRGETSLAIARKLGKARAVEVLKKAGGVE